MSSFLSACACVVLVWPALPAFSDNIVPPIVPTDLINPIERNALGIGGVQNLGSRAATERAAMSRLNILDVIKRVGPKDFPTDAPTSGSSLKDVDSASGILFRVEENSSAKALSPANFELSDGRIFVSVRRPAKVALVNIPHAVVAIESGSEVLITYRDGVLRVVNMSGVGERVKINIHETAVSASLVKSGAASNYEAGKKGDSQVKTAGIFIALKLGYELVAADRALTQADLRPPFGSPDNFARRRSVVFENDSQAVSEISLSSMLTTCPLLDELRTDGYDKRSRRIFSDLMKMAAVLNYQNGEGGFDAQTKDQKP